jgi:hypothetical protein
VGCTETDAVLDYVPAEFVVISKRLPTSNDVVGLEAGFFDRLPVISDLDLVPRLGSDANEWRIAHGVGERLSSAPSSPGEHGQAHRGDCKDRRDDCRTIEHVVERGEHPST